MAQNTSGEIVMMLAGQACEVLRLLEPLDPQHRGRVLEGCLDLNRAIRSLEVSPLSVRFTDGTLAAFLTSVLAALEKLPALHRHRVLLACIELNRAVRNF